jgi:branched-chain amino acid transport system substrate-binding protein
VNAPGRRRRRRAARSVAIAAIAAIVGTACGAASRSPAATGTPSVPTRSIPAGARRSDPGSNRITVRVAYIGDYSLAEAPSLVAPAYQGASLAAEQATDAGTLPADLEVVSYTTDGDPQKALDVAGEVAADPQIVGVIIAPFTIESAAVGEVLDAAGLPTISLSSLDPSLSANGWASWRRAVAPGTAEIRALVSLARGLPDAREGICIAGDASARATALARVAAGELSDRHVTRVTVPPGDASAAGGAEAVRRAGCGVVLWTGFGTQAAALRTRLAASGVGVQLLATDAAKTDAYLAETGRAGDGTVVSCGCVDVSTSARLAAQRFVNAFQFDIGTSPGPYAVEGWDTGNVFVRTVRTGALTRQEVSAALRGLRGYGGLAGSYHFTSAGELAPSSAAVRFYRAEGGRWLAIGSEDGSRPFELRTDGVLAVGSCRRGDPFAFRRHGTFRGFDVAVARWLASRMELRLAWRALRCGAEEHALASGRVDILADVERPPPRRSEGTRVYLSLRQSLVTARGSTIRRIDHLASRDSLAVVQGSTADRWARRELRDGAVRIERVGSSQRARALLRRGRIDAFLADPWVAAPLARRPDVRIPSDGVDLGDYRVFAVSRGNPGLLAAVDGELGELVRSGIYRHAYRRWFPAARIPPEIGAP